MPTDQDRIDSLNTLREAEADVKESLVAIVDLGVVSDEKRWLDAAQQLSAAFGQLKAAIQS